MYNASKRNIQVPTRQNNFSNPVGMNDGRNPQERLPAENLQKILALLENRAPVVWIFVIVQELTSEQVEKIDVMYNGYGSTEKGYIVPLYKRCYQIQPFLEMKNVKFKIVSDLQNINEVVGLETDQRIEEIYIYNQKGEDGFSSALKVKQKCEKVKGIFMNLDEVIETAQDEIENELRFYQNQKSQIQQRRRCKLLPNYMLLSGMDKTKATLYRGNLYAARNLPQSERKEKFEMFMSLIEEKYMKQKDQYQNILEYRNLNDEHQRDIDNLEVAGRILNFYTKETFYYKNLNTMLRILKSPKQFLPCSFPFFETYKSIRLYYRQTLLRNNRTIPEMTLYRGAKLSQKDRARLTAGSYIQMYGFMSTSFDKQIARQFTDYNGIIFVIKVPKMEISSKYDNYDHGFVDMNDHNLAGSTFQNQKEVLFNALNIYKVNRSYLDEKGCMNYELEYGSIFNLVQKKNLSPKEKQIFTNYQYCTNMLSKVEDQGDTLLLHNELNKAEIYYKNKQQNLKNYYKLANVQYLKGSLNSASKNAKKSLEMAQEEAYKTEKEKCKKICSNHMLVAKIKVQQQDYFEAEKSIDKKLQLLSSDEISYEKANAYRERGEIRFKKGEIVNAEKDFLKSEQILNVLLGDVMWRKFGVKVDFVLEFFKLPWNGKTKQKLDNEYDLKIFNIEEEEKNSEFVKDKIVKERNKVLEALKKVAHEQQDKNKYEVCVKKGRKYILEILEKKTEDVHERALIKAMEAQVQGYVNLTESEKLLGQAIKLIQQKEPMNQKIAEYSQKLAKFQKINLEKYMNPKGSGAGELDSSGVIKFNKAQNKSLYQRCKANLKKAQRILAYNKGNASEDVLEIRNEQAELDQNQNNFTSSERILQEAKKHMGNKVHTNLAKNIFLSCKIAFARGELRWCFEKINESKSILKEARVKTIEGEDREKELKSYRNLDLYLQLKTFRAKVYLQQRNHDLSLKDIECAEYFLKKKEKETPLLPDVLELKGQIYSLQKKYMDSFDVFFKDAINMRQKQHGFYNIQNAKTYCYYAKKLISFEDFDNAQKSLEKAIKIFFKFQSTHPATWILHYINSLYKIKKSLRKNEKNEKQIQEALKEMNQCLTIAEEQFDNSNLVKHKLRYEYGKQLCQVGQSTIGLRQLRKVDKSATENLTESIRRTGKVLNEIDDEKIILRKQVYEVMKRQYEAQNDLRQTQKCTKQIQQLQRNYRFSLWK